MHGDATSIARGQRRVDRGQVRRLAWRAMDGSTDTIACTSTGYHLLTRRKVELTVASGVLSLSEGGRSGVISRAECRPIAWVGQGRMRPLAPLAGLVLDSERGPWIVASMDLTIELDGAGEQATPAPHVWVSADDLARMAAACGIASTRRPIPEAAKVSPGNPMKWVIGLVVVGALGNVAVMLSMRGGAQTPEDCSRQRQPAQELYPRLSCAQARAELDRVARGEAAPRPIVLRPLSFVIEAKDVTGPAKITCDGLEFAVEDANQADPGGPIAYANGPHAVLAEVLPDGRLRRPQYVICGNVVAGERRGELPP